MIVSTERKLWLIDQGLSFQSCKVIAKILKKCQNFSVLELRGNLIGHDGVISLIPAIVKCQNIVSIDLSSNDISGD